MQVVLAKRLVCGRPQGLRAMAAPTCCDIQPFFNTTWLCQGERAKHHHGNTAAKTRKDTSNLDSKQNSPVGPLVLGNPGALMVQHHPGKNRKGSHHHRVTGWT